MYRVCSRTVWSAGALASGRLLKRLLGLVAALGLVLQSLLKLPLRLLLLLQSLLDQSWRGEDKAGLIRISCINQNIT